jgi:2-keto-4-pentenoate hydratase/2-oxohepta-3-ene-1,7-dioic acid hydratase in catechol pathway
MRLVQFQCESQQHFGRLVKDGIVPLAEASGADLRELLALFTAGQMPDVASPEETPIPLNNIRFLPPISNPDKIICVGLNYHEHLEETGRPAAGYPTIFTRFADTQIGHLESIPVPPESTQVDYEGELAVIIGKRADHVKEAEALTYVAGYACYNDVSIRDWQKHGSQWTPGKNFRGTGPFGPWIVTADEIADAGNLRIQTRLNGVTVQSASTRQLIFSIPTLIAYISRFTPLDTGDVICTGTPGGVGFTRKPPLFMKPGDLVDVEIEKIGTLSNPVTASSAPEMS